MAIWIFICSAFCAVLGDVDVDGVPPRVSPDGALSPQPATVSPTTVNSAAETAVCEAGMASPCVGEPARDGARKGAVTDGKTGASDGLELSLDGSHREQDLGGGPLIHCLIALCCPVERQGEVEDLAGVDLAVPDQLNQLGQELPDRGRATVEVNARHEQLVAGDGDVVRDPD